MNDYQMGPIESRFADLIWQKAPLSSGELVMLAQQHLGWKKSTTYTVLKRLCGKGMFENTGGTVTAVMSREEFYARKSESFVQEAFQGSLPAFLAAFTVRKPLKPEEVAQLRQMVAEFEEG